MASPITRAAHRCFEFMDQMKPGDFTNDGEMFEYAYASAIEAVRQEIAKDVRERRARKRLLATIRRQIAESEATDDRP